MEEDEIQESEAQEYVPQMHDCINKMVEIYKSIISYIEKSIELPEILTVFDQHKIIENESLFHDTLNLLSTVSLCRPMKEHKNRINDLILHFKDEMQRMFPKEEIAALFSSNFAILLCFYENNIVDFDFLQENADYYSPLFFFPEFYEHGFEPKFPEHNVIYNTYADRLDEFRIKRKEYHSDSPLVRFILNDDLEGFQTYLASTNTPLDSKIECSPFESTPRRFYHENDELIMYAAVFQAISIFKFLFLNLKKKPDLLPSVVLGGNFEIFHMVESCLKVNSFTAYKAANCHQPQLFEYVMNSYDCKIDLFFVTNIISSLNYQSLEVLVELHPKVLTKNNYINFIFGAACSSGCRVLFDFLIDLPIIDVNCHYEILLFFCL